MILHKLARAVYTAKSPRLLLKEQEAQARKVSKPQEDDPETSHSMQAAPVIRDPREYPQENVDYGKELLRAGFQNIMSKRASYKYDISKTRTIK